MSSINLLRFPWRPGLYISELMNTSEWQKDAQKKKNRVFIVAIASDDGFIFVWPTYKVKSFLFTAWERKINANDRSGH